MSANKIAETSTSAGTGDFTLAGDWSVPDSFLNGNRTFNSFYGLNHRFPYMIQDKSGNWEKGRGYLSGAAVLVRETVIDNSLGTTALIDFAAGDKLVMVPTDAGSLWPETLDSGVPVFSASQYGFASSGRNFIANRPLMSNFLVARPMVVTAMVFEVTTAVASALIKPVIYKAQNQSGTVTMHLISVGAEIDASTTGVKTSSITEINLPAGQYLVGAISNSNPHIRCNNAGGMYVGWYQGVSSAINSTREFPITAGSFDSPPATIIDIAGGGGVSQALRIGLLGRFL